MLAETALPFEETFDGLYGLEIVSMSDDEARAQVVVRDAVKQVMGLVHGGVYAAMAEALTSMATGLVAFRDGNTAQGLSNSTSYVRPILAGTIHATARARHRGRTTWVWDVEFHDDQQRLCAISRITVAVRPNPGAQPAQPG